MNKHIILFSIVLGTICKGALIPSNVNKNPGWSYQVFLKGGIIEGCQATLLPVVNGICRAATASHCLEDAALASGRNFDSTLKAYVGMAKIKTADFGMIDARIFVNPKYLDPTGEYSRTEDSAVFTWECNGAGSVTEVAIHTRELKAEDSVYYGKVMAEKEGLYSGKVFREPGVIAINGLKPGVVQESIWQNGPVIQQGDSGGGLYVKVNGSLELAGVLSTSDDIRRNRTIGNYSTNRALLFVSEIANAGVSQLGYGK